MIRKLARPMLASVYVADGVDTLINAKDRVEGTESVLNHTRTVLPRKYARQIPQDPELVTRAVGGVKVGAGSLLALGKAPRTSATVLAITAVPTILARHAFWETQDAEEKKNRRNGFLTQIGLLGGLAITSVDTAGKPGLKWRAGHAATVANKKVQAALPGKTETQSFVDDAKNWVQDTTSKAQEFIDDNKDDWISAVQGGAAKVSDTVSDYAGKAQSYIDDNKDDWLSAAQSNSKAAKKKVVRAAAQAQDRAQSIYAEADKQSGKRAKKLNKKAGKLQKHADKALNKAQKKLAKKFDF